MIRHDDISFAKPLRPAARRTFSILGTRYDMAVVVLAIFMSISLVTRIVLSVVQHAVAKDGWGAVLKAFAIGEVFDLVASLWLIAPLVVYLTLVRDRWFRSRAQLVILTAATAVTLYVALFVAVAEYFFFEEFNGRFNFVAVDYLVFPTEVANNVWQSYPTAAILIALTAIVAAAIYALRGVFGHVTTSDTPPRQRAAFLLLFATLLAAGSIIVSPALARVSNDRALNEIAENGYYAFWGALMGQDAPYEGLYATRPRDAVFARLHTLLTERSTDPASWSASSTRRLIRSPARARRLNVVIVLEESLGSEFIGALNPGAPSLTPRFDSLAAEGTLLTHAYSTGNRTIRALEATTASIPPLPGISIVRRDQSHDLFTLPALLRARGYQTMFIYGGRAIFDGMGSYMRDNGMQRVIEQRDYPGNAFRTAWGVSDEAIFDKTLALLDSAHAGGRPFYSLVLSVSNHRPFTYPAGRIAANPLEKRRENVVQYADFALGRFMRQARSHAFFDSTLFVLMGDHGARVYGAQEIPLPSYEVPILFYAPGIIRAGARLATTTSSMDVPPTLLALLGGSYESKWFGRDVFALPGDSGRALMTHNNEIALMQGSGLAVLGLRQAADFYRYDSTAKRIVKVQAADSAGRALVEDAIAYFNGADWLYRSGGYRFEQTAAWATRQNPARPDRRAGFVVADATGR